MPRVSESADGRLHGLLIQSGPMAKILDGSKTYEIRNMYCRCVEADSPLYLIRVPEKGMGKNANGQSCLEVVGQAIFRSNIFIQHDEFQSFEELHRVSADDYAKMRKAWNKDNGGCVAWLLDLKENFENPVWLPHCSQEVWYRFNWEDTFKNKDDVPLVARDKRRKAVGDKTQRTNEVDSHGLLETSDNLSGPASSSASKAPQQQVPVSGSDSGVKKKRHDKSVNPVPLPGVLQTWHGWPAAVKSEPREDPNQGSKSAQQEEGQKVSQGASSPSTEPPSPTFLRAVEEDLARQLDALGSDNRESSETPAKDRNQDQTAPDDVSVTSHQSSFKPKKQGSVGHSLDSAMEFLKSKSEHLSSVLNSREKTEGHENNNTGIGASSSITVGVSSAFAERSGSLTDGLAFPKKYVANVLSEAKKFGTLGNLATWVEESTMSSAFSGVGAPETAMMLLHREVQALLPERKVNLPKFTSFVEWDVTCQAELSLFADSLQSDACIFSDISGFFAPHLTEIICELYKKPSFALEVLAPLILNRSAMRRKAWCARHQQNCYLRASKRHSAGSSCTAHSRQGKQLALADRNVVHLLAWIGLRVEVQEQELDLENVDAFPTAVLDRMLGHLYHIEPVQLDPRMFGFPIARVRKYHRMRHKEAALCEVSPLSRFLKRFHQAVNFSWREFLVLSPKEDGVIVGEFQHELDWAQGRPLSMIHCFRKDMDDGSDNEVTKKVNNIISNYGVDRVSVAKDIILEAGGPERQPYLASLNVSEIESRSAYAKKFPGQAWQLNQNAGVHGQCSTDMWLHTLIRNCGLIWVDKLSRDGRNEGETQPSRWFFGTEALLAQGFPVHPVMHQGFKACAFNFRRLERKGTKVREQSGNSMHVSCPFVCILHSACCWKPSQMTNRIVDEVMLFRDVAVQSVALAESAKKRDQEQDRAAKSKSSSTSRPPAVPSKRMRQKGPDP